MSDRDETTGQFSGAEPLVGERALEADQGYIPAEEAPVETGPEDTADLASTLADARGGEDGPDPVLGLTVDPDDTSPKQAYSQDQLVGEITGQRLVHEAYVERVGNEEIAAFADNIREYLGPELGLAPAKEPTASHDAPVGHPTAETAPSADGLAPDLEQALKHPQVRQAIEAELSEAGRQREAYTNSLQVGQQMLQATVAALAPQLDGMPLEYWPQAIQNLAQVDPVRANLVADTLQKWGALQQAQQHSQHQQAYVQHQQFEATVTAEDARLTQLFNGDESAADEATNATISYLSEHGIPRDQMLGVFKANPVLSTAEARRTIWEAAKYRDIQKARVTASARPAPQVQRPGIAASAAERQASSVDAKTARARDRIARGEGGVKDISAILGNLRRA